MLDIQLSWSNESATETKTTTEFSVAKMQREGDLDNRATSSQSS